MPCSTYFASLSQVSFGKAFRNLWVVTDIAASTVFLLLAEIGYVRSSKLEYYYCHNWPLLGPKAGLVTSGLTASFLGLVMLGNLDSRLNEEKMNIDKKTMRTLVSTCGIAAVLVGVINAVAVRSVPLTIESANLTFDLI